MTLSHTSADSHEIRGLTGIRGYAAVHVVSLHFWSSWLLLLPCLNVIEAPISRGYLGVDMFFILSGFILNYVYNVGHKKLDLREYGHFLWYRLARIYPNHLATLLILVFLVLFAHFFGVALSGSYSISDLPYQLTLTHCWPLDPKGAGGSWNFPSWSISAEWFAYLAIFPITAFLLQRVRSTALALFLGVAALIVWPVYHYVLLSGHLQKEAYRGLIHVSCEFFAGAMFFNAFLLGGNLIRFCQQYLTGLFVLLAILYFVPFSAWVESTIVLIFPFILIGLTSEASTTARLFSRPLALWLGRLSYALYMTHGIAEKIIKIVLPSSHFAHSLLAVRFFVLLGQLYLIFVMMVGLHYLVEIPSRNFLRNIWSPKVRNYDEKVASLARSSI